MEAHANENNYFEVSWALGLLAKFEIYAVANRKIRFYVLCGADWDCGEWSRKR